MKTKESLLASILAFVFTFFLIIIFLVEGIIVFLNINVFNTDNLVKNINIKELIDDVKDDIIEESVAQYGGDIEELDEVIDVIFEKEFINLALAEVWDAELYGDGKVDRKALEKAFDDATEDFFEENSKKYSSKDVKYLKGEILDYFEEIIEESASSDFISDEQEIAVMIRDYCTKLVYLLLLVSVVLIGILVLLYKNKARVFGFAGIAMTISQSLNLFLTLGLSKLVGAFLNETAGEAAEVNDFIGALFQRFTKNAYILFLSLLVLGVLLIVLGKVLSKSFNETETLEDFDL
ncbi:MAG: hypothetical protein MJ172_07120 [Clostridia bacterium]|nr:hypothetical protein [Clostridia bacterium]